MNDKAAQPGTTEGPTYIEAVLRQARSCPMTFEELVAGCTDDEREQLAWHLAQLRARKTYEALRRKAYVDRELANGR